MVTASSGEEAIKCLKSDEYQMIFSDLKMGKLSGLDVLQHCKEHCPNTLMIIMTAYGTVETAVEAMRMGAFDFIIKPFPPDHVDILIQKASQWFQLNERNHYFKNEITSPSGNAKKIIGTSEELREILRLVHRVAPTKATVLITGESGTGKELVASEVHRLSDPDKKKPYIRMNCAAVPENLLESELFGHEKGAFTGATERRIGRFELADHGTLLLDELGEISLGMQAKLLRVLQESEFERVGGNKTIKVDVRVVATTNRDLKREVSSGNFREDLYYRLNVFPIRLPALRERGTDIKRIAKSFLQRQETKLRRQLQFSEDSLRCMMKYPWPGNIRELENVIERIAILEDGPVIHDSSLPPEIIHSERDLTLTSRKSMSLDDVLNIKEIEKIAIHKALRKTNGNRSRAAELLGFSVRTLRNKLHEYESCSLSEEGISNYHEECTTLV